MNFNYFYNAGSLPFRKLQPQMQQEQLSSFWRGDTFKSLLSSTDKMYSSVYSVATYPVDQFFYDSLNYSLLQMKEINQDLAINPVSENFQETAVKSKFSLKKFFIIGTATLALQMGVTLLHTNSDSTLDSVALNQTSSLNVDYTSSVSNMDTTTIINKTSVNNNIDKTTSDNNIFNIPNTNNINTNTKNINKINSVNNGFNSSFSQFITNSVYHANPVESLRQDLPKEIIKLPKYMQSMFSSKTEATLHVLNVAEGTEYKFYRDNKGIAIAKGWNPTRNTKEFNLQIAQEAGLDAEQTAAILLVSDTNKINYVPKKLKHIRLTKEQAQKVTIALIPHYESGFLEAMTYHAVRNGKNPDKYIAAYHELPNNQQAVMIHMAYKVGTENLMNYKTFYKKLFSYMDKPTKANLHQVQKNFTYTFATLEGERLHDTRVEEIHQGIFSDCAISPDPKSKEKISSKINQCRNIANLTNPETVKSIKTNVAGIQTKMAKMFG